MLRVDDDAVDLNAAASPRKGGVGDGNTRIVANENTATPYIGKGWRPQIQFFAKHRLQPFAVFHQIGEDLALF